MIMAVYQLRINEKMSLGKSLVAYLQSIPQIVTFEKPAVAKEEEYISKEELLDDLNDAFRDVRLMMDGKKKKKTLDELIHELRNSND
jgi:hypothetical protein